LRIIEQIGQDISSVLELDPLLKETARLIKQVIDYQTFGIFLVDRKKGEFLPHMAIGYDEEALRRKPLRLDEGIRGEALRLRRPVLVSDVQSDPRHVKYKLAIDDVVRSQMVIPLQTKNEIVGVLVLGNVRKGLYDSSHLRIAHGMATQIAIALENARVFEEVAVSEEEMRHEFEIARSLQLSMLPECCPYVPGFEVQAKSLPAVRVGGDFYDFINLDDGHFGIVVGDVSGYGLPGALVMASAREVIRIYSELDPDPAAVMNRADARLKRDLTSHMFVSLLYGVLDIRQPTFKFCNAGLIEPALIRNGQARFINSPGSRLPLGKIPDGKYQPRMVRLKPHDTMVLATDGVVEAYGPDQKQFGFRRYLKTLVSAGNETEIQASVDDIISAVFNKLRQFVGEEGFPDDVTILTLKVKPEAE
jgi:sigma-B regulation protein RsbU (phosphoserine phosphatase)